MSMRVMVRWTLSLWCTLLLGPVWAESAPSPSPVSANTSPSRGPRREWRPA